MEELAAWLLPQYTGWVLAYIFFAFLLAGVVKGFLGMGLPAVLMITLTLFIPPVEAISLILVPMLFTNVYQFFRSRRPLATAKRYAPFAVSTIAAIMLVSINIKSYPEALLLATLGIAMVLYSLNTLFGFPVRIGPHPGWQVLGGIASGVIGGLSAVWSPPVVVYLMGRNADKEEFISAVGYLFMVGSVGLIVALGTISVFTPQVAGQSLVTLAVALIGFGIGEYARGFVSTELFRKCVLVAFLVLGTRLVLVSLLP